MIVPITDYFNFLSDYVLDKFVFLLFVLNFDYKVKNFCIIFWFNKTSNTSCVILIKKNTNSCPKILSTRF